MPEFPRQVPFPETQWNLIADATLAGSPEGQAALGELYRRYEKPVLSYIQRHVYDQSQVEDLAQGFWVHLIERRTWKRADMEKGRFRQFLLTVLTNFLASESRQRLAEKRGGKIEHLEFEPDAMGTKVISEAAAGFDRDWATLLLERALTEAREGFVTSGKESIFTALARFLPGAAAPPSYEDAARQAGISADQLRVELHRLRAKLRENLRRQIAATVTSPAEIEEEFLHLRKVLAQVY